MRIDDNNSLPHSFINGEENTNVSPSSNNSLTLPQQAIHEAGSNSSQASLVGVNLSVIVLDSDKSEAELLEEILTEWLKTEECQKSLENCEKGAAIIRTVFNAEGEEKGILEFTNLNLPSFPEKIFLLKTFQNNLVGLDLIGNPIKVLPKTIFELTNLNVLFAASCGLQSVPAELASLPQLAYLDLSNNPITELPSLLGDNQVLVMLHINNTQVKELPRMLTNCPFLENIGIENTPITPEKLDELLKKRAAVSSANMILTNWKATANEEAAVAILSCIAYDLSHLDLSNKQLEDLPAIFHIPNLFPKLISINLSNNPNLSTLPDALENCMELLKINVDNTKILPTRAFDMIDMCASKKAILRWKSLPLLTQTHIPARHVRQIGLWLSNLESYTKLTEDEIKTIESILLTLLDPSQKTQELVQQLLSLYPHNDVPLLQARIILEKWVQDAPEEKKQKREIAAKKILDAAIESRATLDLSNSELDDVADVFAIENLFPHLMYINLSNNPELSSLPTSIDQCTSLQDVYLKNTNVPPHFTLELIERCAGHEALNKWNIVLRSKAFLANKPIPNNPLSDPERFSSQQSSLIGRWLYRLEESSDFKYQRDPLIENIYNILTTLTQPHTPQITEFSAHFFDLLSVNLEGCGDRAAILYNLVYTEWKLCTLDPNASIKDKLGLLEGISKAMTLRAELDEMFKDDKENAEKYLFIERTLKDELKLVSPIVTTKYVPDPEEQTNIDTKMLSATVQSKYVDILVNLRAFESLVENHPTYSAGSSLLKQNSFSALNAIEESDKNEGTKLSQSNNIMNQLSTNLTTLKKKILKKLQQLS